MPVIQMSSPRTVQFPIDKLPNEIHIKILIRLNVANRIKLERVSKRWQANVNYANSLQTALDIQFSFYSRISLNNPDDICNHLDHQFDDKTNVVLMAFSDLLIMKVVARFKNLLALNLRDAKRSWHTGKEQFTSAEILGFKLHLQVPSIEHVSASIPNGFELLKGFDRTRLRCAKYKTFYATSNCSACFPYNHRQPCGDPGHKSFFFYGRHHVNM